MADFGMNLRVTMDSKQGGRKYMEDVLAVTFKKTDDGRNIEYTYLAVFDGHGGSEAAKFAREHLLDEVTKHKGFWSNDDSEVEKAIRDGFLSTHKLMWKAVGTWPKTLSGYPSTAGTTASVCFIRNGKMYIAHVGDSTVVVGMKKEDDNPDGVKAWSVTKDHKPECPQELKRIQGCGGNVVPKAGVPRVVWNRPKLHQGCVRRSTNVDSIPFLAIARALGDLWSYNATNDKFVVSPDPDICTTTVDLKKQKFIILASDGLWNMVSFQEAVDIVNELDPEARHPVHGRKPASHLVHTALERWSKRMLRADNTSVIVAYFDPPGMPPKDLLLRTPSDVSTASTLKASDSEESLSDGERDDIDLAEDSHQLLNGAWMTPPPRSLKTGGDAKPSLKRLPAPGVSPRPLTPKSASSSKIGFSKLFNQNKEKVNGVHSKGEQDTNIIYEADSDYDPSKASIISVRYLSPNQAHKRPSSSKDMCSSLPSKRPRLATPESSQVLNSPIPGVNGVRTRRLSGQLPSQSSSSCSPLKLDVSEAPAMPAASVSSEPMISPLWPSHLADDLDSSDSVTAIKPHLAKGESIPRDVLQENLSSAKMASTSSSPSMHGKANVAGKSTQGSQNRSPMTRACVKRLSGSPRYSIRRQSRLSPHTSKLHTVHRTRVTRKSTTPKRS